MLLGGGLCRHRATFAASLSAAHSTAALQGTTRRCATTTAGTTAPTSASPGVGSSTVSSSNRGGAASTSAKTAVGAAAAAAASASASVTPSSLQMTYRPRWRYAAPFRGKSMFDFVCCRTGTEHAVVVAHTYKHATLDITVTLIPLRHFAHPAFFRQVDDLCSQHDSVLMEGRMPLTGAPFSTLVPPRERVTNVRPPDNEDDEGWEPREVAAFFQPFSWGVRDSPNFTVVHAADKYDYERLPWWCSVRFSAPIVGSFAREKHCLDMIAPLRSNGYKSFAVPWGAAHMPIFHEMLIDNDFEPIGLCSLLMLSRVDGPISEAEYDVISRWQRRRARRETAFYVLTAFGIAAFVISYARVDYRRGPALDE